MKEEQEFIRQLTQTKTQEAAFGKLINMYKVPLYNHLRIILLNHDDTNDVLQNTFIKVFQNISKFKGDSKLFSWIFRISTNEALNFLKQKAVKNRISEEDVNKKIIEKISEDELYTGDEIQLLLQKAVAQLPQKQQLVFKMKYYEELDYQTMSEILETSVGALKASYHHAVKKIEIFLKDH